MILNNKQLTKAMQSIEALQEQIDTIKDSKETIDLLQLHAWKCRMDDLKAEIDKFNSLVKASELVFSEDNLLKGVISLRIASGMTQRQLADAIGIQEQQIQRYEQNHYRTASFERVVQILKVLSKSLELKAILKKEENKPRFETIFLKFPIVKQKTEEIIERQALMTYGYSNTNVV